MQCYNKDKPLCNTNVKGNYIKMKKFFSISQTAKIVGMTTETLRHYDRIDLVKPCKTDEWTGYRYYSQQEIVRLNTIKALRYMDLSLSEMKDLLAYEDFNKIVAALQQAERSTEEKIAELNRAKTKIQRARIYYESKLNGEQIKEKIFIKQFPQRVILVSDKLETPTLENLWNYHRHFYEQVSDRMKKEFSFEDLAGIYEENGTSRLFAICTRFTQMDGIKLLPQGKYLCADCMEENREQIMYELIEISKNKYNVIPDFTIQLIVLSGILQWNYQVQVFISN